MVNSKSCLGVVRPERLTASRPAVKHDSPFTIYHSRLLEDQPSPQLNLPRRGDGRADAPEGGERALAVGRAGDGEEVRRGEVGPVEEVEGFEAELEDGVLAEARQARVLDGREVEDSEVGADEGSAPERAEAAGGLEHEGVGVEPLVGPARDGRLVREAGREAR